MEILKNKHFFFIGIGGLSMRSLAELLILKDKKVSGFDKKKPKNIDSKINIVSENTKLDESIDCVIYNTITDKNDPFLIEARNRNIQLVHRSKLLEALTSDRQKFLVSGTYGKTSISFFLSNILEQTNHNPFCIIGERMYEEKCYKINTGPYVIEHNEADLKHFQETSDVMILNNFDHTNHLWDYQNAEEFYELYENTLNKSKIVIYNIDNEGAKNLIKNVSNPIKISFGTSENADWRITNIVENLNFITFELNHNEKIYHLKANLHGQFSALNVTAAIIATYHVEKDLDKIIKAISNLKHPIARFEEIYSDYNKKVFSFSNGSTESLKANIETLKKYNKPINIIINQGINRSLALLDEFQVILNEYKCAVLPDSIFAKEIKDSIVIHNQNDFNTFFNSCSGIVMIVHSKYCFNKYLYNLNIKVPNY